MALIRAMTTTPITNTTNAVNQAMPATFFGIGVGPGDPELITHKAARILAEVDWIFYPSTASGGGLAREIVAGLGLPEEKFRRAGIEMSRQRDGASVDYRRAAEEIAAELAPGDPWPGSPRAIRCFTAPSYTCGAK